MTTVKKENGKLRFENEPDEEHVQITLPVRVFYETLLLVDSICKKTDLNRAQVIKEAVKLTIRPRS